MVVEYRKTYVWVLINDLGNDQCEIVLLSRFLPRGLMGLLYWYVLCPFHQYVFTSMLKGMVNASGLKFMTHPERFTPKITKTYTLSDS